MVRLLDLPGRAVWHVPDSSPACFCLVDELAGGILVNTPRFAATLARALMQITPVDFLFYPSRRGARDVDRWRGALGARSIASAEEAPGIAGTIDEAVDAGVRFYGRLDFLPLAGRTRGTCGLRSRVAPGIVFFGPALEHDVWPVLVRHEDDDSYENRVIGALGVHGLEFEFAFCDNYSHGSSRFGPGASQAVAERLAAVLEL